MQAIVAARGHAVSICIVAALSRATVACVGIIGEGSVNGDDGSVIAAAGDGGPTTIADGSGSDAMMPAGIRRLTMGEFDNTTSVLLQTSIRFANSPITDQRQGGMLVQGQLVGGFTRNAAAIFDTTSTPMLNTVAQQIAQDSVMNNLATLAPCTGTSATDQQQCASSFISTFGALAYRRPVTSAELDALLQVYAAGVSGQDYAGGIELVLETILQSPWYLYLTELGDQVTNWVTTMTSYEIASELSYFLTAGPPDAMLMQAAAADTLRDPATRAAHATRLLMTPAAQVQIAAFVEQWLGVDTPPGSLKTDMVNETNALVADVVFNGDSSLNSLLTANYTFVDAQLAALYGLPAPANGIARVDTAGQRIGLLNQGSFLTTYSHQPFSAPVKRGHAIRTLMLCDAIPPPDPTLMVNTAPQVGTATETTRQAQAAHETSAACAGCHHLMDDIGFGFENLTGWAPTGPWRPEWRSTIAGPSTLPEP